MTKISVALLDVDGTLLDSNEAHALAWVEALREFEIQRDFNEIRKLIGMGSDQLIPRIFSSIPDDEVIQRISERRGAIFRDKYLPHLKPFRGTRELIQKMRRLSISPIVTTSASSDDVRGLLEQAKISDLIEFTVSSDDVEHSKPCVDILRAALNKVGCAPAHAAMIGDTPYDIAAAKKARIKTLAFTSGGWAATNLSDAVAIYSGPEDLHQRFEQSIFCRPLKTKKMFRVSN